MSKIILVSLISISIAGCASTTELANKTPDLQFSSEKSARDIAACVSSNWGKRIANVSTNLLVNGYTVALLHPHAGADAVVSITESSEGSRIAYSERMPSLSPAWMKEGVIACK